MTAIDDVLPHYDAHEVHSIAYERSLGEALATPVAADPFVRLLFRLRGVPTEGTIADLFGRLRFEELARTDHEVVFGGAGTPWRPRGGIPPFARAAPRTRRVAAHLFIDRARLSNETRIEGVDEAARRAVPRHLRIVWARSGPVSPP